LAEFDQATIDHICEAVATAALAEADRLGLLAHEETGYGVPADKAVKNRFAAGDVHTFFRGLRTVGIVRQTETLLEIASPRGVVAAIIPSTNPTSTAIFKILIAIKSRNGVVLSPHPSAARCIGETARVLNEAALDAGAPAGIIGCMSVATIEGTEALMKHKRTAVILATGGIGLVRAAYSSGKPAFGVGPGNVPAYVDASANVSKAARDILTGKCFDNGTICASEQAVIAHRAIDAELRAEFESRGARFLTSDEADRLARVVATASNTLNSRAGRDYASRRRALHDRRRWWCGSRLPPLDGKAVADPGLLHSGLRRGGDEPLRAGAPLWRHGTYGGGPRPLSPGRRSLWHGDAGVANRRQHAGHARGNRFFDRPRTEHDARLRQLGW
jgi:acyl-CoA reductase-like NAD-dependent aldehyde dehydrogenase